MNKSKRLKRQQELLSHFEEDSYQEKFINGQWYVKQWNGNTSMWQVAVYSPESFRRYKQFYDSKSQQNNHMRSIKNE